MQFATIESTASRPDLPVITDEEAAALARTTVNRFRVGQLSDIEARTLLGDMAQRTWARWKDGSIGRIDRDLRARMAILMGIHKGLRYLFSDPARGYDWIRKPNAAFNGQSALDVMMRGEITDLIDLRSYLDAERGAW
uniref:MbcA/ParS/Xre antitoxin family protein n=1 Tax=Yoonia sp. TaxID=2212373 RepID=UPI004048125D